MEYKEIEVRFLEIDAAQLISKLHELHAIDHGEELLKEVIIYDDKLTWRDGGHTFLRLRTYGGKTYLAYKHRREVSITGVDEIEFEVGDADAAEALFVRLGYVPYRHQEKKRHSFTLGDVTVDIDTWPRVPTYVELEGPNEDALKYAAGLLGLDWSVAELRTPRMVIEETYNIPVGNMQWFTFERFE